ncbi:MAG: polyprenyl synthetase family protein, partial [Bacteroidia bacterium]|nr:polyprenyl synthetase family protein [Bacteroidia bacterium]
VATDAQKKELQQLLTNSATDKVEKVLQIFHNNHVDKWALELQNKYLDEALIHLEDIAVLSKRKQPLRELAQNLLKRDH